MTEQNKDGAGLDALSLKDNSLSFFLFFVLCLSYHFKCQTVSNLFFSSALFTVLIARC